MDALEATAHPSGYALSFGGEFVDIFPTWEGLRAGYRAAILAQFMLSALLERAPRRRAA
jgi:hypothetical protein